MKKIKIFLITNEETLEQDKMEISNFLRYLNETYRHEQLYFSLDYDIDELEEGELFFIILEKDLNEDTKNIFEKTYNYFKENTNPKIATYFKKTKTPSKNILDFMKHLGEELGHYYSEYENVDTIKLNMLMLFESLGLKEVKLETKEGNIYLNGKAWIDTSSLPLVKNNIELSKLKKSYNELDEAYWSLLEQVKANPEDNELLDQYIETKQKRTETANDISALEQDIISMESSFVKMSSEGLLSRRQIYARKCLENGDITSAIEALSIEEIDNEAEQSLKKLDAIKEELQVYVDEYIMRASALKLDYSNPNRFKEIEESYEKAIKLEKDASLKPLTLYTYAQYLYSETKYEKAEEYLNKYIDYLKSENLNIESDLYILLSAISRALSNYDKCEEYLKEAIEAKEKNNSSGINLPTIFTLLTRLYMETDCYNEALEASLSMLEYLEKAYKENPEYYVDDLLTLHETLGDLYCEKNDLTSALNHYTTALSILQETEMEEEEKLAYIASINNGIGLLCKKSQDLDNAASSILDAIKDYEELYEKNEQKYSQKLADTYKNYALILNEKGKTEEALEYTKKAQNIFKLHPSTSNILEMFQTLSTETLTYIDSLEYEKAETSAKKALKLIEKHYKQNPNVYAFEYANALNNLGTVYLKMEDYEKSSQFLPESYNITLNLCVQNEDVYIDLLLTCASNLVNLYTSNNKYEEAKKVTKETDAIINKHTKGEDEERKKSILNFYNNVAVLYFELNDLQKGKNYIEKSIEIAETLVKKNPSKREILINVYNNATALYSTLNQKSETLKYVDKAIKTIDILCENSPVTYLELLIDTYLNGAQLYKNFDEHQEAISILESIYSFLKSLIKTQPEDWINTYIYIGNELINLYKETKENKKLKTIETEIKKIMKKYDISSNLDQEYEKATNYCKNGDKKYKEKKYKEAETNYLKSVSIFESITSETLDFSSEIALNYLSLSFIYEEEQREDDELNCLLKIIDLKEKDFDNNLHKGEDEQNDSTAAILCEAYTNISDIYKNKNKLDLVITYLKKALSMREYTPDEDTENTYACLLDTYKNIIENNPEDFEKCNQLFEEEIEFIKNINEKAFFKSHLANTYYQYALYLHKNKLEEKANPYFIEAIEIKRAAAKEDSKYIISLAELYFLTTPLVEPISLAIEYISLCSVLYEMLYKIRKLPEIKETLEASYKIQISFLQKNNQNKEAEEVSKKLSALINEDE